MSRLHTPDRVRTDPSRPIPERTALPYVGHALSMPQGSGLVDHLLRECEELGPIFRLRVFGDEQLVVSGSDLVAELSNPEIYSKSVSTDLVRLRDIGGDGLFTAYGHEPNWRKAHNILMPSFTRDAMRQYHSKMVIAARHLVGSWERSAAVDGHVDVSRDMTRLTFDTIGMCGFGQDFDSFTDDDVHPFVASMIRTLTYAQQLSQSPPLLNRLRLRGNRQYAEDLASMQTLITEVIERRRSEDPTRNDDLLGRMLNTADPDTGELLDDANIRNQVVTFLIAGHETTGAAMSFALHYLTKHPAVLVRAQREVDRLWGRDDQPDPTFEDVGRLTYVRQILDEALRLWPTAPGFALSPNRDTTVGDGYEIKKGEVLQVFTPALHRQPEWGANVHGFDPDRFSPEAIAARPGHVYKPFGHGERACIGRQFALHEATLVLAMLIHRFHLDDRTNYQLSLSMTLTIKPDAFFLTPRTRTANDRHSSPTEPTASPDIDRADSGTSSNSFTRVSVFHGSNLGTSASVARELAAAGTTKGFTTAVAPLDAAIGRIDDFTTSELMVVVASSYNGRPTDDASAFFRWVQSLERGSLDGLFYTVLGIGDRSYADTYQHVPTVIDQALDAAGATRVAPRGAADVGGNYAGAVQDWSAELWHTTGEIARNDAQRDDTSESTLTLEPVAPLAAQRVEHHGLSPMTVVESYELVDIDHPLGRSKRFVRLRLPDGASYRTGDHLAVLSSNPKELIDRVAARFEIELDTPVRVRLSGWWNSAFPTDRPVSIRELLRDYVELQRPATAEDVALLAESCPCPPERRPLEDLAAALASDTAHTATGGGESVLDLLERHRSVELTLDRFLALLPALEPRRYSISSSATGDASTVDLMVSVVDAPHRYSAVDESRRYRGITSSFISRTVAGDSVDARVVPCNDHFRLTPTQPAIVIAAGTGLAPFRAMIADRRAAGTAAPLITYFGCDHPDVDYLHRHELEAAERDGFVSLRTTFAFDPVNGHRFVQERMIDEADEIWALVRAGAHIRVCGDAARLGVGVEQALRTIFDRCAPADIGVDAEQWLAQLRRERRYVCDVW